MKLFVWLRLMDCYGDHLGHAFIMAEDEDEASELLAIDFKGYAPAPQRADYVLDVRDDDGFESFSYKVE